MKDTVPSPLLLTAGPPARHQQIAHGLGYSPDAAVTEPPLGLKSPAKSGLGQSPNPGENLAGTILRIRSELLSANILQEAKLSPDWPKFAFQLRSGPVGAMIGPICPQNLTVFAKTCLEITPTMSHWPGEI